jgi:hypothetical protein
MTTISTRETRAGELTPASPAPKLPLPIDTKVSSFAETVFQGAKTTLSTLERVFTPLALGLQATAIFQASILTSSFFAQSLTMTSFIGGGLLCSKGAYDIFEGATKLVRGEKAGKTSNSKALAKIKALMQILNGLSQVALGILLILVACGKFSLIAQPWVIPLIFFIPAILTLIKNGIQLKLILSRVPLSKKDQKMGVVLDQLDEGDKETLNKLLAEDDKIIKEKEALREKIEADLIKISDLTNKFYKSKKSKEILQLEQRQLQKEKNAKLSQLSKLERRQEELQLEVKNTVKMKETVFPWNLAFTTFSSLLYVAGFAMGMGTIAHLINFCSASFIEGIALSTASISKIQSIFTNQTNKTSPTYTTHPKGFETIVPTDYYGSGKDSSDDEDDEASINPDVYEARIPVPSAFRPHSPFRRGSVSFSSADDTTADELSDSE